jgi:putative transposase
MPRVVTRRPQKIEERSRRASKRLRGKAQLVLPFRAGWGGARPGAGRKPKGERRGTPHRARPVQRPEHPVHVTLRAAFGPLRSRFLFPTVRSAIAGATRRDSRRFRVVHFSVQSDHLHLIVEAADKRALSTGMRSIAIRVARSVNRLLNAKGRVWADRWHGRALESPRAVRNALVYVLGNFRKHSRRPVPPGIDPYSSAAWFSGFRGARGAAASALPFASRPPPCNDERRPVSEARTWLLSVGWRRHGLIDLVEAPSTSGPRAAPLTPSAL